jgi:hypothetical protein
MTGITRWVLREVGGWCFDHAFRLLVTIFLFLVLSSCFLFLCTHIRHWQASHYLPFYRGRYLFKWCWSLGAVIYKDIYARNVLLTYMWWW